MSYPTVVELAALWLSIWCLYDAYRLRTAHAKPLAHWLNVLRWLIGLASLVALAIGSSQRLVVVVTLVVYGAIFFLPYRWLLAASGGRQPKWELRYLMSKIGPLSNTPLRRYARPHKQVAAMRRLMDRVERLRSPELAELCDLELAQGKEFLADEESILVSAWRRLRIHELELELYGDLAPQALFDADEATRRWRLYRTFGWMIDFGSPDISPDTYLGNETRVCFDDLLAELGQYRSSDTDRFIDLVTESAMNWLAKEPKTGRWIPDEGLDALGPAVDSEMRRLWPTAAAFFGARLDERDAEFFSRPDVVAAVRTGIHR